MKRIKRIKRILILLAATVILPCAAHAADIKLGDYVQMGELYDAPVLWRCVGFEKVSGYDDAGNPIIDSYDTVMEYQDGYIPLMLSDKVIAIKAFDAQMSSNKETGSHSRHTEVTHRIVGGSNYWADSNIRSWLISDADAGAVEWLCGNPPSYKNEAGFLNGFEYYEKAAIQPSVQKTTLAWADELVLLGTDVGAGEYCTDTIFLLDERQLNMVSMNSSVSGVYDMGILTAEAAEKSGYVSGFSHTQEYYRAKEGRIWSYWLRTPATWINNQTRFFGNNGKVDETNSSDSSYGVRPAFHLADSAEFAGGDGTVENPYTIANTVPEPEKTPEPEITVMVDGVKLEFDQPPVIRNDRTLVPFRAIFEALGCEVDWSEENKNIIASKKGFDIEEAQQKAEEHIAISGEDIEIALSIENKIMKKNIISWSPSYGDWGMPWISGWAGWEDEEEIELDYPPIIINDRTMVPVRAISEALGCTVEWYGETKTVEIKTEGEI